MNKLIRLLMVYLGIILVFISQISVEASELKFSVEPLLPENQVNKEHTYFDLSMKTNQRQTIKIHMNNNTNKDIVVVPQIEAATTNINGVVEYGKSNNKLDSTTPYNISDLVKIEKNEVQIPANSSYDLAINITMPEQKFKGVLAGGITLQEKDEPKEENREKNRSGLAIKNKYAYVVALVLQESMEETPENLILEKVAPKQVNARNTISTTLKNPEARYINQLSIQTKITRKGEQKALYSSKKEGMQMAPNTSFDYPVFLKGEKLHPGKYILFMKAKTSTNEWEFNKEFEIKSDVAKKLNASDVTIKKDNHSWMYFVIVIIIIILVLFLILRRRKANN